MGTRISGFTFFTSPDGVNPSVDGLVYDGTVTKSANFIAQPILVEKVGTLGIQFSCPATGTPLGSFALQGSNDVSKQEGNNKPDSYLVNWSTLSFYDEATGSTVQSKAVSGASSFMVSIPVVSPRWLRIVWTNTSGTIAPTIRAVEKSVA